MEKTLSSGTYNGIPSLIDSNSYLVIGGGGGASSFYGKISDVQLYNIALTDIQAEQLYLNNSVNDAAPIAYWPLSGGLNGTYNVTPDITGNGNSGYLYSNLTLQACRSKDVIDGTCG
ncbi:LamG domain protein jellyroll fold domain protein, partial [mine drainage metagenome]